MEGQVLGLVGLVARLLSRDDWSIRDQWVVNTWVRNQVSLEFVQVDVQGTIETERRGDGADNLGDQAVKVVVRWARDTQVLTADLENSIVVDKESTVRVLNCRVSRENSVVWLNNSSADTWSWVDSKLKLALLAVVLGDTLLEKSTETRTGSTTEGVEDQETLKGGAIV